METSLFVMEYGLLEYLQSNISKYVISFDLLFDIQNLKIYQYTSVGMF